MFKFYIGLDEERMERDGLDVEQAWEQINEMIIETGDINTVSKGFYETNDSGARSYLFLLLDDTAWFMNKEGFDNIDEKQGSCYYTSKKLFYIDVDRIIKKAFIELPWLPECVSRISIAEKRNEEYNYIGLAQRINKSKKHKEDLAKYHRSIKKKSKSR